MPQLANVQRSVRIEERGVKVDKIENYIDRANLGCLISKISLRMCTGV